MITKSIILFAIITLDNGILVLSDIGSRVQKEKKKNNYKLLDELNQTGWCTKKFLAYIPAGKKI